MTPEEREELLAAYALGTLPDQEAADVEALVRADPSAAADLAAYYEIVDLIALSAPLRRADPSLRQRVLEGARRESRRAVRRTPWRTLAPWVAAAAASFFLLGLTLDMQRDITSLQRENATLTSIVEDSAKRLDEFVLDGGPGASADDVRVELQAALADQQLVLAVTADPDVQSSVLQATASGHGASGRYLWSQSMEAGVVVVRGLPTLPIGREYQVWLEDGTFAVPGGTFEPDPSGNAEVVARPAEHIDPSRILIAVAPIGGSAEVGSPVILVGLVQQ